MSRRPAVLLRVALAAAIGVVAAGCTGGATDDGPSADVSRPTERDDASDAGSASAPLVIPQVGDVPADPPLASRPTGDGCTATVTAPASIQDAIDAITDRARPTVLCLEGRFVGGGSPAQADRPGVGPYYGGIVIAGRANLTLRGLPGSVITGVPNDQAYPEDGAPPDAMAAFDKGNLIKVVDSTDIVLEWLQIDGRVAAPAGKGPDKDRTLNRLVWFQHSTDSTLRYSRVEHAGGECVRIKANSQRNEVHHNVIGDCGFYQFKVQKEPRLRKNGEAVYIGTDPSQIAETQIERQRYWGLDPTLVTDRSSFNKVHHNVLRPGPDGADWGNECVDMKEDWPAAQVRLRGDLERGEPGHNLVSDNDCAGQFDEESGAFDSRGPNNVLQHNLVSGPVEGAAIRIGASDKSVGAAGTVAWRASNNVVRLNRLERFGYKRALKVFKDQPLAEVCGNVDAKGRADFGGDFSSLPAIATNRPICPGDDTTAGPRGPVGVPDIGR